MKNKLSFLLFILITNTLTAQTIDATLVEINFQEDSDPQNFVDFQSGFYFTATDGNFRNFGRELWYSDGTSTGNQMVKDIKQGQNSSNPSSLVISNNYLYFTADDGIHGSELWKSDGTESGTVMVKDIRPDNNNSYNEPTNLIDFNGTLFFTATNGVDGYELWKSNGTEASTIMVKDINLNGNGNPNDLFIFNNSIYFTANDGTNGTELWKSDGTEGGTVIVKDINPNYSGLNSSNKFLTLNNFFYFFANNETNGYELWKSDGTESGTTIVKDIRVGQRSSASILKGSSIDNLIIFEATDGINGTELWRSDGTEVGTTIIKNINNTNFGSISSISNNSPYITFNNEVYFLADDNIHGSEIWKSDGTKTGTSMLKDINDGNLSVWIEKFYLDNINNKLLFYTTSTNSYDRTIWVSDGSSDGTFELSNITDSNTSGLEESFVSVNNATVFTGENDINGNELWVTDGTVAGTSFFADLNYSNSSNPSKFTNVNGDLFFRARGTEYGNQLFKSDGTEIGTQLVKDINPGYECIDDTSEMREINGVLYFSATDGAHGYELWKSDGTERGTFMVKDIRNGNQSGLQYGNLQYYTFGQEFTAINDILYFNANDGVHGFELWRSDGTESGTFMIKDIYSSSNSFARQFVLLNNKIYFIANDNIGTALWVTDGTKSGTSKIINLNDIEVLKAVNDKLIIVAETSGTTYGPHDLWVSDGTASGTNHLQSFGDGIDTGIQFTTILNDELYFVAQNPNSYSKAVYKTDGTVSGTIVLFDRANLPTMPNLDINFIMTCSNYVYFPVQNSYKSPKELWRTNGTITEQVAGPDSLNLSFYRNLTCYNNNLLYLAESFPHKIWITNDNLNEPLQLDVNILNGPNFENYNSIEEMGATDNHLYFRARNDLSGNELYITDIDASTLSINDYEINESRNFQIVKLYPNPSKGFTTIESITNSNIKGFEIWDLSGKRIHKELNKNSTSIVYDTNELSDGIYFVKVFLRDNKIDTLKLIVKH